MPVAACTQRVCSIIIGLRVHADTPTEAWDVLEHELAPRALTVPGVHDVHLPRRGEIRAKDHTAACEVRLVITAEDTRAALILTDGPVRQALAELEPDVSVTGSRASVLPFRRAQRLRMLATG